jgi:transposase
MFSNKINSKDIKSNNDKFDYYIALDWSQRNMAIASLRNESKKPRIRDTRTDIEELKAYLVSLKGRKILTIEETTSTHWLFVELYDYADKILVCDPYRNKLLSDGPKTDKLDAGNLCLLLRSGLLKEVYHSLEKSYELRQLVSDYEQLVKFGTRILNEKSAIYRGVGKSYKDLEEVDNKVTEWIISKKDERIELYYSQKEEYENKFKELVKRNKDLKNLTEVNGIWNIGAVKILASVIDAKRFEKSGKYISYCGLVKHQKMSGGRNYGKRKTRYSRRLKSVYKTAAMSVINGNSPLREYYDSLIKKGISEDRARNALARRIATITYGILKTGTRYAPYKWREK